MLMLASFDKLQNLNSFHIYLLIKTDLETDFLMPKYGIPSYKQKKIEVYIFSSED